MLASLLIASLMVVLTVSIHFVGLYGLSRLLETRGHKFHLHKGAFNLGALVIFIVLCLFAIHTIQIWIYAGLFLALGEFGTFEEALYFSTTTFTTVGYGDVLMDSRWRMVAAIESANGFLLLGWSTAFLVSVVTRIRQVDLPWLNEDSGA